MDLRVRTGIYIWQFLGHDSSIFYCIVLHGPVKSGAISDT